MSHSANDIMHALYLENLSKLPPNEAASEAGRQAAEALTAVIEKGVKSMMRFGSTREEALQSLAHYFQGEPPKARRHQPPQLTIVR